MNKTLSLYLSMVVVVLHLLISVWYYNHLLFWDADHKAIGKAWYMGLGVILIGVNMMISTTSTLRVTRHVVFFHAVYVILVGISFMVYYLGVFNGVTYESIGNMSLGMFVIFVAIIYSIHRYKLIGK